MYANRSRKVKTDKRDARALCEACHLGAYRAVHRVSDGSRMLRRQLATRAVLVQTRSRMISLCRALLRQEGIRVPSGDAVSFVKRVRTLELSAELASTLSPLLKTHEHVSEQIKGPRCVDREGSQARRARQAVDHRSERRAGDRAN